MPNQKQIDICVKFWVDLMADKGRGQMTRSLASKFGRHLKKTIEDDAVGLAFVSLAGQPMETISRALKSCKLENPFPVEWLDVVFTDDGDVQLFRDGVFERELE